MAHIHAFTCKLFTPIFRAVKSAGGQNVEPIRPVNGRREGDGKNTGHSYSFIKS
jgi:hypothetical protein